MLGILATDMLYWWK